jgi:hypothetical protein
MVLDEETAGWQGDGVSVGFDASAEYHQVVQLKSKLVQLAARVDALRAAEEKIVSERERMETCIAHGGSQPPSQSESPVRTINLTQSHKDRDHLRDGQSGEPR